ncbi:hypothetical protein [Paenibacillus taichungensis]|uniref:hypothetical protein n=1 Tax=Paenibacillus taichungensis TaxID=484184 RepID=UPI0035DE21D1
MAIKLQTFRRHYSSLLKRQGILRDAFYCLNMKKCERVQDRLNSLKRGPCNKLGKALSERKQQMKV